MSPDPVTDCILIGYNDTDFGAFAATQKSLQNHSGAYHEVKANSLIMHGKRLTYMDMLNHGIAEATGRNPGLNVFEAPSQGVCYLASYLLKRDFKVEVVNFFTYEKERLQKLLAESPRAVAITTTFYVDNAPIVEIVAFIRKHCPDTRIIVGGPHIFNLASDLDEETQGYVFEMLIGADVYIIDSQGEHTLGEVIRELRNGGNLEALPNLYYRNGDGGFHRTPRRVENNDLSENSVDWTCFDRSLVGSIAYVRTARSCPYTCSFCNYPTMAGAYVNTSLDRVERELRMLKEIGTTDIVFIDDTFNYPLSRFKKMLRMMIENQFGFRWVSFLRCSNVDQEALLLMKDSGCVGVLLGIESGDQRILELMNKSAKLDRYQWAMGELNRLGIASFASLICGFPGETEESIRNTIDFIEASQPTFFNVQLYYHDTRASIQKRAEDLKIHGAGYNWRHGSMDWKEAARWAAYMFENIRNSIPLGLYGFSLWGISYLISRGLTMDQVREFGRITRPMLLRSFADDDTQVPEEEARLVELCRGIAL
jgi:radical SAM PhpK family P-methyltransferase